MTRNLQKKKIEARKKRRNQNRQKWKKSSETDKQRIRQDWIDRAAGKAKQKYKRGKKEGAE